MLAIKVMKNYLLTCCFEFVNKTENARRVYCRNGQNLQYSIATEKQDKNSVIKIQLQFFCALDNMQYEDILNYKKLQTSI